MSRWAPETEDSLRERAEEERRRVEEMGGVRPPPLLPVGPARRTPMQKHKEEEEARKRKMDEEAKNALADFERSLAGDDVPAQPKGMAAPTFVKGAVMGGSAIGTSPPLHAFPLISSSASSQPAHSTPVMLPPNAPPQHFFPSTPTMGGQSISKVTPSPVAAISSSTPTPAEPPARKTAAFAFNDDDDDEPQMKGPIPKGGAAGRKRMLAELASEFQKEQKARDDRRVAVDREMAREKEREKERERERERLAGIAAAAAANAAKLQQMQHHQQLPPPGGPTVPPGATTIAIMMPPALDQLHLINNLATFTARQGYDFEQLVMAKEVNNPRFGFLYMPGHPDNTYYRWKVFSLTQGDRVEVWKCMPLQMTPGGPFFLPPPCPALMGSVASMHNPITAPHLPLSQARTLPPQLPQAALFVPSLPSSAPQPVHVPPQHLPVPPNLQIMPPRMPLQGVTVVPQPFYRAPIPAPAPPPRDQDDWDGRDRDRGDSRDRDRDRDRDRYAWRPSSDIENRSSSRSSTLGQYGRNELDTLLKGLSQDRPKILQCMGWALEHAESAAEIIETIVASLTSPPMAPLPPS